ncbi:MAG TPA: hypothetical protein VGF89_01035 [Steroidobacteraceae bacterium]|jgi:hypothetical protein
MAVSFQSVPVAAWGNALSPSGSAAFAPTAASDQLLCVGLNGSGTGLNAIFSGTGTFTSLTSINDINNGNSVTAYVNAACSGASQTVTNTGATGQFMWSWVLEYIGATTVTAVANLSHTPGAGAGAILGTSQSVPSGQILVALCMDTSGGTTAISSPGGTNRGSGSLGAGTSIPYCWTEYAGAGAAIQPSFTSSSGAAHSFVIIQFLLTPPATSFPPVPESLSLKSQVNALLVN